jgi:F0F1-type ATP synthase assembly protein I
MTSSDDRAPYAKAYGLASRGVSVALGMVVPGLVGYLVDQRLGTRVAFTLMGFVAGVSFGIWQLLQMGKNQIGKSEPNRGGDD